MDARTTHVPMADQVKEIPASRINLLAAAAIADRVSARTIRNLAAKTIVNPPVDALQAGATAVPPMADVACIPVRRAVVADLAAESASGR